MSNTAKKSLTFYIPIIGVLFLGFSLGGLLAFGSQFLDVFNNLSTRGRFVLTLFGMGMLGACVYCAKWMSKDLKHCENSPDRQPNAYNWFGYATTVVGGGIIGVVFYLFLRGGFAVVSSQNAPSDYRLSSAVVISFLGGLFTFRIQEMLSEWLTNFAKPKSPPGAQTEAPPPEPPVSGPST